MTKMTVTRLQQMKLLMLMSILLLATGLRFYKLGQAPLGFTWDEAAITYNAWSVALWHRDEYATFMPLSFKSYGDYKSPLLVYALAAPFKLIGLQENLIRVYAALAGVLAVALTYGIAIWITKPWKTLTAAQKQAVAWVSALLLAMSPWHLQFSRSGYEANVALTLVLLGIWALLVARLKPIFYLLASTVVVASLYTYHNTKIFVPFFLLGFALLFARQRWSQWRWWLPSLALALLMSLPLAKDTFIGEGGARAQTLLLFDQQGQLQSPGVIMQTLVRHTFQQVSLPFLIEGYDAASSRHTVAGHGVLYRTQVFLLLAGLGWLFTQRQRKEAWLLVVWLVVGFMPAILGDLTPHALRSLLALPAVTLISSFGLVWLASRGSEVFKQRTSIVIAAILVLLAIELGRYLLFYYHTYALESALDHQFGYKEAVQIAQEKGRQVDKVIMTDSYGQPYIYTLLYRRIKPQEFLFGALANHEFRPINWPETTVDTLYIGTPAEIPPTDPLVLETVALPNGQPVFVIAQTPEE